MEVKELLANLSHPDEAIRHKAFLALGNARRRDRGWVPDLIAAVTHGTPGARSCAIGALGGIGPPAAEAVPALVALLSSPDLPANREGAARALAKIGPSAAKEVVPALVRVLEEDEDQRVCKSVLDSLGYLARSLGESTVYDAEAIPPFIEALNHSDEGMRQEAAIQLKCLGGRAQDALPALRRLLDSEGEPEAVRLQANSAVEAILSGKSPLRLDEPYHSISGALEQGRFAEASVAEEARRRIDHDDFEAALELLDASIEGDQDSMFWLLMFNGARELELPSQHRYYERYLETSGLGGFWHEMTRVVYSSTPVSKGMRKIIRYCSRAEPHPGWKLFYELELDEDLLRLEAWLEAVFTQKPPSDDIPGLWFGIVDLDRGGQATCDLYVSGGFPDEEEPQDRVIGGSWDPANRYAHSGVLDQIHKIAYAKDEEALEDADYRLSLTYAALAVRWLATTLDPELLLGRAPQRVLAVGFEDGDSIGVGTLNREGLVFPGK